MSLSWAQLILSSRELSLFGAFAPGARIDVPRRAALPALAYPFTQELMYQQELLGLSQRVHGLVRERLIPRLGELVELYTRDVRDESEIPDAPTARTDAKGQDAAQLLASLIRDLEKQCGISAAEAEKMALTMIGDVQLKHGADFAKTYGKVLPVNPLVGREKWLKQAMRVATRENVDLIQSIPDQQLKQVERIVSNAMISGTQVKEIASQIYERFDVSDKRAMLIARDQMGKWHGSLQRLRQVDAGVTSYEWSASGDERTRPKHRERDGKIFKWSEPPDDGHPGVPVSCRCVALPVFDDEPELPVVPPAPPPVAKPAPTPRAPKPAAPRKPKPPVAPTPPAPAPVPPVVTVAAPKPPAAPPRAPKPPARPVVPVAKPRAPAAPPIIPGQRNPLPYGKPGEAIAPRATKVRDLLAAEIAATKPAASYAIADQVHMSAAALAEARAMQQRVAQTLGLKVVTPINSVLRLPKSVQGDTFGAVDQYGNVYLGPLGLAERHEKPMHTLVHEMIHTMGGAADKAYGGRAKVIEEAVTEELAHAYMGWTDRGAKRIIGAGLHEPGKITSADVAAAKLDPQPKAAMYSHLSKRGILYKPTEGSYVGYRREIYQAISAVTGETDFEKIRTRMRDAGIRWKGAAYATETQAINAFCDALAEDADQRAVYKALFDGNTAQIAP